MVGFSLLFPCTAEKQKVSAAPEEKSGFFSYFMPWRKKSGPPRAKLPSDREPKVSDSCSIYYIAVRTCAQCSVYVYKDLDVNAGLGYCSIFLCYRLYGMSNRRSG